MSVVYRLTVDRYEQMIRAGILGENDPVELIRGELRTKMPIGSAHAAAVNRLNRQLQRQVAKRALVSIQNPVVLADSEPEPDVTVLTPREDDYSLNNPRAADVLLLIEVADSSVDFDRTVKLSLYAESGIGDYWIINLLDSQFEIYRQPQPDGTYQEQRTLLRGEEASLLALPDVRLAVDDIVG